MSLLAAALAVAGALLLIHTQWQQSAALKG
jgi:hypothetical protein